MRMFMDEATTSTLKQWQGSGNKQIHREPQSSNVAISCSASILRNSDFRPVCVDRCQIEFFITLSAFIFPSLRRNAYFAFCNSLQMVSRAAANSEKNEGGQEGKKCWEISHRPVAFTSCLTRSLIHDLVKFSTCSWDNTIWVIIELNWSYSLSSGAGISRLSRALSIQHMANHSAW